MESKGSGVSTDGANDRPYELPRPRQLDDLSPDQIVAVLMRLAMEVCVLRDRLATHEQLLGQRDVMSRDEVEAYVPSGDESVRRQQARNDLIENIIKDLS